jgi:hypothetical protein
MVRVRQIVTPTFVVAHPRSDVCLQEGRTPARRIIVALVVLLVALGASRAEAEPVTLSFGFVASGFETGAPVDPVTGSFTVSFDNSSSLLNQTAGLTYHDLNIMLDSAPSFDYGPALDVLVLGAAASGGANVVGTGENDLVFAVTNASTNPKAGPVFIYSQASILRPFTGSFVLTPLATPTPEPATLVLFGTGAVALIRRRRFGER